MPTCSCDEYDECNIQVSPSLLLPVCRECGSVVDMLTFEDTPEYWKSNSTEPKTWIPYSYKMYNIHRLHKWQFVPYSETEINKLFRYVDSLEGLSDNIKRVSKISLKDFYITDKIVSRNNVRRGLICYCIYYAHLYLEVNVNIKDLFVLLKIKPHHYNSAVKKIKKNQLFYPDNLDSYLGIIKVDLDKNNLIRLYSDLYSRNIKFNKKSIILGVIFFVLKQKEIKTNFFIKFNISKVSIGKILNFMCENDIE